MLDCRKLNKSLASKIVYNQLTTKKNAIWSRLFASGYLKAKSYEARDMFCSMVRDWFDGSSSNYNDFIKVLLRGDVKAIYTRYVELFQNLHIRKSKTKTEIDGKIV